jgi:hypothetical protein
MAGVTKLPLVEATAPGGAKSLWVAAVPQHEAVAAVAAAIPANHSIKLLSLRLTLGRKSVDLKPGEVRKVLL